MSIFITNGDRLHNPSSPHSDVPSYQQIAESWGVCWQRVWQVEKRALQKIREAVEQEAAAAGVTPEEWMRGE